MNSYILEFYIFYKFETYLFHLLTFLHFMFGVRALKHKAVNWRTIGVHLVVH